MKKKKLLNLSAIILGILICFSFSKVQATASAFGQEINRGNLKTVSVANALSTRISSKILGISKERESGNYYQWNVNTVGEGKTAWKIATYPSLGSNIRVYSDLYYCLNATRGFGLNNGEMAEGAKDSYTSSYDMKDSNQKNSIINYAAGRLGDNYNKILWILDNSYIPTQDSNYKESIEYKNLMDKAGINIENDISDLTEEQIEVVQQMAIWYFTNSTDENYHLSSGSLPSIYINGKQLSGIEYGRTEWGEVISGTVIYNKMNTLYKYFINNALSAYTPATPALSLSNTTAKVEEDGNYYIAGPFSLTGENIEGIKSITANVNKPYTLLNSSKNAVTGNDFSKVVGSNFYLRFDKNKITETTQIDLTLTYKYDVRTLTFMTDENDPENTQPVVMVKTEEKTENINTNIDINLTSVNVEKVWDDNNNQDGVRPTSVKVVLYAGSNKIDEQTLKASNSWKYTWSGLLAGKSYSVKELDENGNPIIIDINSNNKKYNNDYTTVIYSISGNKTTITNMHEPEKINVNGTKTWVDNNDQDGKRPNSITINLLANGTKINSKEVIGPDWSYSFSNLPKYENGTEIKYVIDEEAVEGYEKTITGYNVTNKHIPETIEKTVTKLWEDNKDQDGKRAEYGVTLYANGEVYGEEVKLDKETLSYTWKNLPKYKDGVEIKYTVEETTVPEGYSVSKSEDGFTITNTYAPEIIEKTVTKEWKDNNNQDGKRADYGVTLYADGEIYGEEVKLDKETLSYTWKNLPKYKDGVEIKYTVEETTVPEEYSVSKSEDGFKIINTYTPGKVQKTVTKVWNDNDNQDGKRPNSIIVQLYKTVDGIKTSLGDAYKVELSSGEDQIWQENEQKYTWNNLPKKENGKDIVYSVEETIIPQEYTVTYSDDTFTITNTYVPGTIEKTVIKKWNDENNKDNIRPNNIIVTLYKEVNGIKQKVDSQRLSEANNWTYTWLDLPQKENSQTIIYSVDENNIDGYTAKYSAEDFRETDTITITNTHTPIETFGKYSVILRKVNNLGEELTEATIRVNGKDYIVGKATILENEKLNSDEDFILQYALEEIKSPEGYLGLSIVKNIKVKVEVEKLDNTYNITRAYLVDNEGNRIESDSEVSINLSNSTNTITINVVNNPIKKEFDLSLRKFITKVNDDELQREPIVDTTSIHTTGTATYKHTKEPVAVQVGDIVTYKIRVYNEGEIDGYASQITDHLPEWLDFLPDDETNLKYLWQQDINDNRKITTNVTSKDSATGESLYSSRQNKQLLSAYNGGESLDHIDLEIKCRVNEKALVKQLITNIAEISEMQDKEGAEVITDRDSTKANVNLPIDSDLPNYKGNEANKEDLSDKDYYYKGQEDDDDFEKLIVENFDLALRKFIIAVNNTELKSDVIEGNKYTREPSVDTSKLGTTDENGNIITTAKYNHSKNPVLVEKGDIVTYIIRIYNEGTLSGYANEIIDNIPEGLEFVEDSTINKNYGWTLKDGKIVTNYLSDENVNNIINSVVEDTQGNKILSYKDVQVQFKVIAEPSTYTGEYITNWAEISADSNNDIDSTPGNDVKQEDDIDYEPVDLVYFDLALRKFITNVDGTEYNNRVPEVDTSKMGKINQETGKKITTATYTHTKDPVILETGSIVTYTIRIYNEGTIAGYATEITDNIPEGLEFLPENETNTSYKWLMLDEEGKITQDVSKAVRITTNYLSEENDSSNIISAYQEENGNISLDYKDVKVAFKVIEPNTSDRIVVNTAQISKDSSDDIDSIPGNDILTEDDIDREYVRVETFDLALEKWVTATKVTYNGKTKITKTGFTAESTEMAKVDLIASQLKKTTVKFVYSIRVINEGQVAGYATEIKDYVPSGLKFVQEDNKNWTLQKDGTVTTDQLKDTLLEPGQSATVELTLTWKNSSTNMGVKTNWAEISADSGDDIDSTPDNNNKLEDDIDDAKVILSIKTGSVKMYIALAFVSIIILGGGTFLIKKYVISK